VQPQNCLDTLGATAPAEAGAVEGRHVWFEDRRELGTKDIKAPLIDAVRVSRIALHSRWPLATGPHDPTARMLPTLDDVIALVPPRPGLEVSGLADHGSRRGFRPSFVVQGRRRTPEQGDCDDRNDISHASSFHVGHITLSRSAAGRSPVRCNACEATSSCWARTRSTSKCPDDSRGSLGRAPTCRSAANAGGSAASDAPVRLQPACLSSEPYGCRGGSSNTRWTSIPHPAPCWTRPRKTTESPSIQWRPTRVSFPAVTASRTRGPNTSWTRAATAAHDIVCFFPSSRTRSGSDKRSRSVRMSFVARAFFRSPANAFAASRSTPSGGLQSPSATPVAEAGAG
jgi:hypothetical protein